MKRIGFFKMDDNAKLRPLDYKIIKLIEHYKKKSIPDYYSNYEWENPRF